MVGAERFEPGELFVARGAGDDLGAEHLRQQHAAGADAARGAQHQHFVAGFHGAVRDQHAVRGAVGDRQRRGIFEADAGRHRHQLVGGDAAIFRHAAVEHLAHQAFLLVDRVDQHAVAGFPASHAGADLGDLARHVEPDDHRQRHLDARHAAHGEDVVIVERRRTHADDHFAVAGLRRRVIGDDVEIVEAAVAAENQGFHRSCIPSHAFLSGADDDNGERPLPSPAARVRQTPLRESHRPRLRRRRP